MSDPGYLDRDEFYEQAMEPGFPDEMAFQIEHDDPDPDRSFSVEGLDELALKFKMFVMARVHARWKQTGEGPKKLRATVYLTWEPKHPMEDAGPFYHLFDSKHREDAL